MTEPIDLTKRVQQYVSLRDKIKEMEEEHKTKLKPFKETLEQLGNVLLGHLNTINSNSANTDAGTVYRTERKSASIADKGAFWAVVKETEDWDLIDVRANSTAVEDYIEKHGVQPPGVNFSRMFTVGVRRA